MNKNNGTSQEMYGVSRIDDALRYTHAWRVSLLRHGKRYVKNFPDKRFAGKAPALAAAKLYRDELLRKHKPITRQEFCDVKRKHNTTGITGVCTYSKKYTLKDGSTKEIWYWEANWPGAAGENRRKAFSVKRYGDELAKQMAVRARKQGLQAVEGVFWTAERGDVAHLANIANTAEQWMDQEERRAS